MASFAFMSFLAFISFAHSFILSFSQAVRQSVTPFTHSAILPFFYSFIHVISFHSISLIHSSIHPSIHPAIHSFIHSFIYFIHSFIHFFHSFIHSFHSFLPFHSFIHSLISFIHSVSHAFIHSFSSFIHSIIHSFHSFIHPSIHPCIHSFHSIPFRSIPFHSIPFHSINSFFHSVIRSIIHSFMHSFVHPFTSLHFSLHFTSLYFTSLHLFHPVCLSFFHVRCSFFHFRSFLSAFFWYLSHSFFSFIRSFIIWFILSLSLLFNPSFFHAFVHWVDSCISLLPLALVSPEACHVNAAAYRPSSRQLISRFHCYFSKTSAPVRLGTTDRNVLLIPVHLRKNGCAWPCQYEAKQRLLGYPRVRNTDNQLLPHHATSAVLRDRQEMASLFSQRLLMPSGPSEQFNS